MPVFAVWASSSSPRLPFCQISFFRGLRCRASHGEKSRTQSFTQWSMINRISFILQPCAWIKWQWHTSRSQSPSLFVNRSFRLMWVCYIITVTVLRTFSNLSIQLIWCVVCLMTTWLSMRVSCVFFCCLVRINVFIDVLLLLGVERKPV